MHIDIVILVSVLSTLLSDAYMLNYMYKQVWTQT